MTLASIFEQVAGKPVEDRTYNIGEISQKTGLMKTANGWVEPPKGKAPGAKAGAGKSGQINTSWSKSDVVSSVPSGWKKAEGVQTVPNGYVAITNGKPRFGEGGRETKIIKKEDFEKGSNPALEASSKELDSLYKKSGVDEFVKTSMSEVISGKKSLDQHWIDLEKFKKASPFYEQIKSEEKKNHKLRGMETESSDSAPRVLTGDCKVRIRK